MLSSALKRFVLDSPPISDDTPKATQRALDLQNIDGILCFMVRPHSDDRRTPKTDACTRVVPVHLKLIKAGVLALKETPDCLLPSSGSGNIQARNQRCCAGLRTTVASALLACGSTTKQSPAIRNSNSLDSDTHQLSPPIAKPKSISSWRFLSVMPDTNSFNSRDITLTDSMIMRPSFPRTSTA